ncbi:MAG: immune inhibitor A domain-containing protein, partial [Candidatus Nanopelagicales bacterium]
LYFGTDQESLKTYYEKQSSGRYTVEGTTTSWVKVPFNEARYGRSTDPVDDDENGSPEPGDPVVCSSIVCNNTWALVEDGMEAWVADRQAAGLTDEQVAAELAAFDVYDRYDFDGDGDFNESDGYVDHLQIVHSGGDEADGDPIQGEDAIWSHRWYAYVTDAGSTGPEQNPLGGTEVGGTGIWAGDYTIQPENGGLSTIAHEYGHDLGLPDHYDTAGGQNGIDWWTLMAQSRVSAKADQGIGTRAADLSAWDKLQQGWLDYEVVLANQKKKLELGPHEYNSNKAQGVVVVLPKKSRTDEYVTPFEGENVWWSDKGDDLNNTLSRTLDLTGVTTAELSLQANYAIESGYDYLYVEASLDGGQTWTALDGTVGGEEFIDANPDPDVRKPAISGSSGGEWVDVSVPMDAAAGQVVQWRFRYATDGGVAPNGFFADAISVTADGTEVFADGAENGPGDWVVDGFQIMDGTVTGEYDNYYIASNRSYVSFDQYLQTGPYNFGFTDTRPDWVEHFSYQQGLLVSYWDTSQTDNNTSQHPGEAEIMQIDSHPQPIYRLDGAPWRARIQTYDSPFSNKKADSFTLHVNSQPSYIRGQAGNPVFDDTKSYRNPALPQVGVDLPGVGVKIKVLEEKGTSMTIRIN